MLQLDVRWPDVEIDAIARRYRKYEEEAAKSPLNQVAEQMANDLFRRSGSDSFWDSPEVVPVTVELDQDFDGKTISQSVIELSGRISGPPGLIQKGRIVGAGYDQEFEISADGRFRRKVVLSSGVNNLSLMTGNVIIDQRIKLTREPVALRVTLSWDTDESDIDLHLIDPSGRVCYYKSKQVDTMQLDVDNTAGYGPENIYVRDPASGRYSIRVQNYARGIGTQATVYVFVNERLRDTHTMIFSSEKQSFDVESYTF